MRLSVLPERILSMTESQHDLANRKPSGTRTGHGEDQLFLMLEWLTFTPTAEEIARGLVTSYLAHHGVMKARFSLESEDGTLMHIGQHGYSTYPIGKVESAEQWRSRDREHATRDCILDENFVGFDPTMKVVLAGLRERGVPKGWIVLVFDHAVTNEEEVIREITMFSRLLSFYLIPRYKEFFDRPQHLQTVKNVSRGDFTARQIQIVKGMVEGKTNHELATDLGYSVSTIRHETMRIFQILGVSDRREAARTALELTII
jgi:DNA-binding CsgD family transcriptional regulator